MKPALQRVHAPRHAPPRRPSRPLRLGLTGSIGMGKSAVAAMFRRLGIAVFDADAEVRALQGPGGALLPAIERAFPGTTGPDGVDRAALGAAVLGDRARLTLLESLVHPAVAAAQRRFLRRHRSAGLVVLDVPLLFEKGGWRRVDRVLVVSALPWQQRARVLARPGMNAAKLRHILALQMADHEKRARADWIINTGLSRRETEAAVRALVSCIRRGLA